MIGLLIRNAPLIAGAGGMYYIASTDYTEETPIKESFSDREYEREKAEYTSWCWKVTAGAATIYVVLSINGTV